MNRAVSDTNVILNTVVSSSLWLISSSLIILKEPIIGYNNKLKVAIEGMRFGVNQSVNYVGVKKVHLKKIHQESHPAQHLETLDDENKLPSSESKQEKKPTIAKSPTVKTEGHNTELITSFAVSGITSYLIINYLYNIYKCLYFMVILIKHKKK